MSQKGRYPPARLRAFPTDADRFPTFVTAERGNSSQPDAFEQKWPEGAFDIEF